VNVSDAGVHFILNVSPNSLPDMLSVLLPRGIVDNVSPLLADNQPTDDGFASKLAYALTVFVPSLLCGTVTVVAYSTWLDPLIL
jgi:hypothetical protein